MFFAASLIGSGSIESWQSLPWSEIQLLSKHLNTAKNADTSTTTDYSFYLKSVPVSMIVPVVVKGIPAGLPKIKARIKQKDFNNFLKDKNILKISLIHVYIYISYLWYLTFLFYIVGNPSWFWNIFNREGCSCAFWKERQYRKYFLLLFLWVEV